MAEPLQHLIQEAIRIHGEWPVGKGQTFILNDGFMLVQRDENDQWFICGCGGFGTRIQLTLAHFGL